MLAKEYIDLHLADLMHSNS